MYCKVSGLVRVCVCVGVGVRASVTAYMCGHINCRINLNDSCLGKTNQGQSASRIFAQVQLHALSNDT